MTPTEPLDSLWHSFHRSLRVQGKASRTIELYGQSIDHFSRWLTEQGMPTDLSELTRDNVRRSRERATQTAGRHRYNPLASAPRWTRCGELVPADAAEVHPTRCASRRPTQPLTALGVDEDSALIDHGGAVSSDIKGKVITELVGVVVHPALRRERGAWKPT